MSLESSHTQPEISSVYVPSETTYPAWEAGFSELAKIRFRHHDGINDFMMIGARSFEISHSDRFRLSTVLVASEINKISEPFRVTYTTLLLDGMFVNMVCFWLYVF